MSFITVLAFFVAGCFLLLALYVGSIFFFRWFSRRHMELNALGQPMNDGGAMSSLPDSMQESAFVGFRKSHAVTLGAVVVFGIILLVLVQYNVFGIADWLAN